MILHFAVGLGVVILAAQVAIIILLAGKRNRKRDDPDIPQESVPFRNLKKNKPEPPAPNHDNMTVNLLSLDDRNLAAREIPGEGDHADKDIPPIDEAETIIGRVASAGSPRPACRAVIHYDDNNRRAMYEMYEDTVLIGRDPGICDIALRGENNGKVSRCHALLRYTDNMLFIIDLNSRNKTFAYDMEVDGKVQITSDCTVRIADTPIKITLIK